MAFLYLLSTERISLFFCKSGDSLLKAYFLFFIEVLSTLMQPFSLIVRLFVNFIVGFFLLNIINIFLDRFLGPSFLYFGLFLVLFELGVFMVQSFIFTYLISSYFIEFS